MTYLAVFVEILFWILVITILTRSVLSWIVQDNSNPLVGIVYHITEPLLGPIRRVLPNLGGFDLSPVVALIVIYVIRTVIRALA